MKLVLVGLPVSGQRLDPFGSIPAMPTALPPLAAAARRLGAEVQVIDGFAAGAEHHFRPAPGVVARGLEPAALAAQVEPDVDLVGVSVHSVAGDSVGRQTVAALRRRWPWVPVVVGGAHPGLMPERFLEAGARWVVRGEGERALGRLIRGDWPAAGVIEAEQVGSLDDLELPDFEVLPLETYWRLGLGHGPVHGPHLDVTTSRGCTQGCRFCATPSLSRGCWRGLSAGRVVELFEGATRRLGVRDFHVEDDDFAADQARVREICELILSQGLDLRLALPSGVRADALDLETAELLARAGCRYLSLAPESGAAAVRRAMGKVVDVDRLVALSEGAVRAGMRVGCFLIVGYPGEGRADRQATARLVEALVRAGVDDLSVFIWSPLPGAYAFDDERGWQRPEQLCWTPRWRARYGLYEGARVGLYLRALSAMVRARPAEVVASAARAVTGRFETKGEMTVNRMLRWRQ